MCNTVIASKFEFKITIKKTVSIYIYRFFGYKIKYLRGTFFYIFIPWLYILNIL